MSISHKYILSFSFVHKYITTFLEFKKAKNTFTNIFRETWFPEDAVSGGFFSVSVLDFD